MPARGNPHASGHAQTLRDCLEEIPHAVRRTVGHDTQGLCVRWGAGGMAVAEWGMSPEASGE